MNTFKYVPEGWIDEPTVLDMSKAREFVEKEQIIQGVVKKCDEKYNLHVNLGNGIHGIIPRNEVEGINVDKEGNPKKSLCTGKVNKYVQFKIKKIDNDGVAILSRREVQEEALDYIKKDLRKGDILTGIVKSIKPYGALIEIGGGIVGLVHIEDLSVARIKTPYERLKIGQKVNIMVKSIEKETGRVFLTYKELLGTWEQNVEKFSVGMITKGIIRETEKNKNGIFVELTPNLVGMAEYTEGLEYGQNVDVYIKKIDKEKKKIKLNIV